MPDTRTVKKIFNWKPLTKRSQGRPKYRWEDNIKQDICQMNIINHIKAQRLSWFGHIQRMPDTRTVKKTFNWKPLTKRSQGRPKYRWEDNIKQDICEMKIQN